MRLVEQVLMEDEDSLHGADLLLYYLAHQLQLNSDIDFDANVNNKVASLVSEELKGIEESQIFGEPY